MLTSASARVGNQMKNNNTHLFLGDPITDHNERRFVERLRTDLAAAGVPATFLANYLADPRGAGRQVDFLIWTDRRLTHVELKTLGPHMALSAPANGPWTQTLPGGQLRTLGNGFRQAQKTTFAISDDLRSLARRGQLAPVRDFKSHIDTVVCIQPGVPAGSTVQAPRHVTICGYGELVDLLSKPGTPPPGWTTEVVHSVARALNLYPEPDDPQAAATREVDLNELAGYRSGIKVELSTGLHDLVPLRLVNAGEVAAIAHEGASAAADASRTLDECLASAAAVTVTGPSGSGKTHLVRHAVARRTGIDAVPVWLSCREYEGDTFSVAMAKAAARFSTRQWSDLFVRARRQGLVPIIVLDGMGECSPDQQRTLLDGARAYRNTHSCALVVTDQAPVPIDAMRHLRTQPPSPEERDLLLTSYGARPLPGADAFSTPWELAMAAMCAAELPSGADAVDVFDTYCRHNSDSEVQREQLRALAITMRRSLRLSLPLAAVRSAIVEHTGRAATADEIDALLASPLLEVGVQRVAFTHETLSHFLAAQHLVTGATEGADLAQQLREPAMAGLSEIALRVETDVNRRVVALRELSDPWLLARAALGDLGAATELRVLAIMRETLRAARVITVAARFVYTDDPQRPGPVPGYWQRPPQTDQDVAVLAACGRCLLAGVLLPEVAALLDDTDARTDEARRLLRGQGVGAPITAVVAVTYNPGMTRTWNDVRPDNGLVAGDLPATIVLGAAYGAKFQYRPGQAPRAVPMRFATPEPARWGRMTAALMLLNVDSPEDLSLLPQLVTEAWNLIGYHLRLAALEAAQMGARNGDEPVREQLREILETFDVSDNLAYSSLLVEALAASGAIEPMATAQDLREEVAAILAEADHPDSGTLARSLLGRQFEDEAIFGPVSQVIAELPPADLVTLCGLAVRDDDSTISIVRDWAVARIADNVAFATPREREVLAAIAGAAPADSFMAHEGLNAHLHALRAWAALSRQLPAPNGDVGLPQRTWRLIDELAFPLLRKLRGGGDAEGAAVGTVSDAGNTRGVDATWEELLDLCRPTAVDALAQMSRCLGWGTEGHDVYARLVEAYPAQLRTLFEWGLDNWSQVQPAIGSRVHASRESLVQALGQLGDDRTRALLESHLEDPEISSAVVAAIGAIEARQAAM
jgi:hypothetical protein